MHIDLDDLPSWSIYVIVAVGVITLLALCYIIETIIACISCAFCRRWYKRLKCLIYYLFCCCLCSPSEQPDNKIEYDPV